MPMLDPAYSLKLTLIVSRFCPNTLVIMVTWVIWI